MQQAEARLKAAAEQKAEQKAAVEGSNADRRCAFCGKAGHDVSIGCPVFEAEIDQPSTPRKTTSEKALEAKPVEGCVCCGSGFRCAGDCPQLGGDGG